MGLLDWGNWTGDKAKDAAISQGLLSAAFSMMAAKGSTGQAIGQGGLAGLGGYQAHMAHQREQEMQDLQRRKIEAETGAIKAKADKTNRLLEELQRYGSPQAGNDAVIQQTGGLAPTRANAAIQGAAPMRSQFHGVPPDAVRADLAFNEGKGISDMIFKRGIPDMQVSGGYAYDKNAVPAGFLPQVKMADNGQTSLVTIGRDGLPRVSAPAGALDTYGRYRNVDEASKAGWDLQTITPAGEAPQLTTRGNLVRNAQVSSQQRSGIIPPAGSKVLPQDQAQRDAERGRILDAELTKEQAGYAAAIRAGDITAATRAQESMAALRREMARGKPTVGLPLQSSDDKIRAETAAKADVEKAVARTGDHEKWRNISGQISRARELLGQNPTGSGVGAIRDKAAGFVGVTTDGATAAAALDTIGGWLMMNVPRMEGPQSNSDRQTYETMAGRVGDRQVPMPQRLAALAELERLQREQARYRDDQGQAEQPKKRRTYNLETRRIE